MNGNGRAADGRQVSADGKDVDLDAIIKHHEKMQEKIAEEMLLLAGNLKENARVANRIVKDDVKVRNMNLKRLIIQCTSKQSNTEVYFLLASFK